MSDIFGDDFTEELKKYYLSALATDVQKFIGLLDEATWKRIKSELQDAIPSWIVDARTNEFEHIADWMVRLLEYITNATSSEAIISYLEVVMKYVQNLILTLKDSAEFPTIYNLNREMQGHSFYLHCKVFDQEFVIPIRNVVEVIPTLPVYSIPQRHVGILGVISFRGDAIPVFNWWDFGFMENEGKPFLYVICEFEGTKFSLQVTEADDLVKVNDKDLQTIESTSIMQEVPFVKNFFIRESQSVMVLDIEMLVAV